MKIINITYKFLLFFLYFASNLCFIYTKQDRLRIKLSKFNKFDVIGKKECCNIINKWKNENMEDKEYRIILDKCMRQICDNNIFPLFINRTNAQYIIVNLMTNDNVNIINIVDNKKNTWVIDMAIMEYHVFLVENNYNPNYYELKTNSIKHFLNIFFLNLLSEEQNKLIFFKKNDYIKFLEEDTRQRSNNKYE
tara:strand:- start:1975 stop:2553 length:579 start_codon:yes stop_codon:yes gene_type:complete